MPTFAYTDAVVTVNAVALTGWVRTATIEVSADELENTAMGATYRSRQGGLKSWSVTLEFNQDFATSSVDQTLWPLLGTVVAVTVKPTSATTSSTNPAYSGNVLISSYSPLSGGVGDLATVSVTWPGSGALSRATS